jgi:Family of unknown function (DUF5519)
MTSIREGAEREEHRSAREITATVASWPVEVAQHRYGGLEFRLGRRELGHLYGDRIADLPFPRRLSYERAARARRRRAITTLGSDG